MNYCTHDRINNGCWLVRKYAAPMLQMSPLSFATLPMLSRRVVVLTDACHTKLYTAAGEQQERWIDCLPEDRAHHAMCGLSRASRPCRCWSSSDPVRGLAAEAAAQGVKRSKALIMKTQQITRSLNCAPSSAQLFPSLTQWIFSPVRAEVMSSAVPRASLRLCMQLACRRS